MINVKQLLVVRFVAPVACAWLCLGSELSTRYLHAVDPTQASAIQVPISERFQTEALAASAEVPDFQKHISPMMGRLGCNGRACHGSFQGQGGFRLSLFGYDFAADLAALRENERVNLAKPLESLILTKPVDADLHEGGKRFEKDGWEYRALRKWLESEGPKSNATIQKLVKLEVIPNSLSFTAIDQKQPLRVFAHWEDGSREDVTCLSRFQSNDPSIATVDERGLVTSGDMGDTHVVVFYDNAVVPIEVLRPVSDRVGERYPVIAAKTKVDQLIQDKLSRLGIIPSELCSDSEFLRRASLDVTGTLPTAKEVEAFLNDKTPNKRDAKIAELLERPGYAAQWTTFFCDMTGNNDEQLKNFLPTNKKDPASTQWYQWIYDRVSKNVPYDDIVEGIVTANSRMPNESYEDYCRAMSEACQDETGRKFAERPGMIYYWARNNFRTAEERAVGFAYTFLGVRIQCAQCHKHPFDQWTKTDFDDFERLFNGIQANQNSYEPDAKKVVTSLLKDLGVDNSLKGNQLRKELAPLLESGKTIPFPELLVNSKAANPKDKDAPKDKNKAVKKKDGKPAVAKARLLGGDWVDLDQKDVRGKLMSWMRDPNNPYFARALVNRVWTHYFSVGIVSPSDDLSLANAPSNTALLDYLSKEFIAHDFDLKWLHREILTSEAYQRSWRPNETNRNDKRNFSHSTLRRLPAEATYDAVWMALANDEKAEELVANGRPRALTVAGASPEIRGGNDTTYALSVFGRNVRESNCDCDRSNEPSLLQTVYLLNDTSVQKWLSDQETGWAASVAKKFNWTVKSDSTVGSSDAKERERFKVLQATYSKQLPKLEERLEKAKEANDQAQIRELEQRKNQIVSQYERYSKRFGTNESSSESDQATTKAESPTQVISDEQSTWIVNEAYLRTLNRKPTAEELSLGMNFLRSQSDRLGAVQSYIWGMVNTKEFILNH